MRSILFYFTFSSFKVVFEEPLPHPPSLHGDHRHGARKRDDHTIPSAGTQATTPTSHPSLAPTPATAIAPFAGTQVMFFSFLSFFVSFLSSVAETSFPHMRVLKPHLSTVRRPSNLASPAAAIASFAGTQVKICFFLLFFVSFLTNVTETLFTPHAGSSNPRLSTT